eukprot:5010606-Prymnesium_polylepis.1
MYAWRSWARAMPPPAFWTTPIVPPSRNVNSSTPAWSGALKAPTRYESNVRIAAVTGLPRARMRQPLHTPRSSATITCLSATEAPRATIGGRTDTQPADSAAAPPRRRRRATAAGGAAPTACCCGAVRASRRGRACTAGDGDTPAAAVAARHKTSAPR